MKSNLLKTGAMLTVLLVFLAATILPAFAASGPIAVTVRNNSGAVVTITLEGPRTYTKTLAPGKSEFTIEPGKYTYTFKACGLTVNKKLKVKGTKSELKIDACKLATLMINNNTHETLIIYLTGPMNYTFRFPPKLSYESVARGVYTYYAIGCGGQSKSGEINIPRFTKWSWHCR